MQHAKPIHEISRKQQKKQSATKKNIQSDILQYLLIITIFKISKIFVYQLKLSSIEVYFNQNMICPKLLNSDIYIKAKFQNIIEYFFR